MKRRRRPIALSSNDPAISHVNRSSGVGCGILIMGDHENSLAKLLIEPAQKFQDRRCILAVKVAGRFVSQQDRRIVDKSPRYGYTLLLTTRERPGLVFHPIGNPQNFEDFRKLRGETSASISDVYGKSAEYMCQPMQGGPLSRPNGGSRHGPRPALFGKCIVAGLANNGGNSGRPNQDDPMERTIAFQVLRTVEKLIFAANHCRECVDSVADFGF